MQQKDEEKNHCGQFTVYGYVQLFSYNFFADDKSYIKNKRYGKWNRMKTTEEEKKKKQANVWVNIYVLCFGKVETCLLEKL